MLAKARIVLSAGSAAALLAAGAGCAVAEESGANVPREVGRCVDTQIAELGSRLKGVPDSGSAIGYANGLYGVSYELVGALTRSRVGDPVRLCLVAIPEDCPPGDDRGKVYAAVNGRTKERWELPDAEHMCGGA